MTLPEPLQRFTEWFADAQKAIPVDPNAAVLATVGVDDRPSARVVLVKSFDAQGLVFYTNLQSRKGQELVAHPWAALCFYWPALERQVRIEGSVVAVPGEEADVYFATRARPSQVGAWASDQSQPLRSAAELKQRVAEAEARFGAGPIPRPPHWSGFRLEPDRVEFWRAQPNRLHERELYTRGQGRWTKQFLYP
jgi:pyridoxamine 5'-phosphate oxidase